MPKWFWFAVLTNLFWGLFSVPAKLAGRTYDPREAFVFVGVGYCAVVLILYAWGARPSFQATPASFAILTGALLAAGMVSYLAAISVGKVSVVVAFTTLYPVITVIISYFLFHETITIRQGIGIMLAPFVGWLLMPR